MLFRSVCDGWLIGDSLGDSLGVIDADDDGDTLGVCDGWLIGVALGDSLGVTDAGDDGDTLGVCDGWLIGDSLGVCVGLSVGFELLGDTLIDGAEVGWLVVTTFVGAFGDRLEDGDGLGALLGIAGGLKIGLDDGLPLTFKGYKVCSPIFNPLSLRTTGC